jgi:hypothetical protein
MPRPIDINLSNGEAAAPQRLANAERRQYSTEISYTSTYVVRPLFPKPRCVSPRFFPRRLLWCMYQHSSSNRGANNAPSSLVGNRRTHCSLQSLYALYNIVSTLLHAQCDTVSTHWKKSVHIARSPPLRFKHRMLLSAASWHGSKYSLYALL